MDLVVICRKMEEIHVNRLELPRPPRTSRVESTNLRDLLKVRDDEVDVRNNHRGQRNETMTLATVLACEKQPFPSASAVPAAGAGPAGPAAGGRTLLDVIRLDEDPGRVDAMPADRGRDGHRHRISWKAFKSLIGLRRAATWPNSSSSTPASTRRSHSAPTTMGVDPTPTAGDNPSIASISDVGLNWGVTMREQIRREQSQMPQESGEEEPIRVSLMALLEEADRSGGGGGSSFATALMGMVEEENEEEEEGGEGRIDTSGDVTAAKAKGGMYVCCVCMVRHKGAAFIPCGHTFCRLCSRELWVSRGNCPLCNGFILEILDIF